MLGLLFTVMLGLQPPNPPAPPPSPSAATPSSQADAAAGLPVSLDRIKGALEQAPPAQPLRGLNETPRFKVEIVEKQKIRLEDLMNNLDFKSGPVPPGGLYAYEQQRQIWPSVSNPLVQPYAAFSQPELVTILAEGLAGRYLAGKAANAITTAQRASAEAAARQEVIHAIEDYCAAQPHGGAGIRICADPSAIR